MPLRVPGSALRKTPLRPRCFSARPSAWPVYARDRPLRAAAGKTALPPLRFHCLDRRSAPHGPLRGTPLVRPLPRWSATCVPLQTPWSAIRPAGAGASGPRASRAQQAAGHAALRRGSGRPERSRGAEHDERVRRLPRRSAPAGPPLRPYSGFRNAGAVAPAGRGDPEDAGPRGVFPACGARLEGGHLLSLRRL